MHRNTCRFGLSGCGGEVPEKSSIEQFEELITNILGQTPVSEETDESTERPEDTIEDD